MCRPHRVAAQEINYGTKEHSCREESMICHIPLTLFTTRNQVSLSLAAVSTALPSPPVISVNPVYPTTGTLSSLSTSLPLLLTGTGGSSSQPFCDPSSSEVSFPASAITRQASILRKLGRGSNSQSLSNDVEMTQGLPRQRQIATLSSV